MSTTQHHPIPDPKAVIQGDVWRVTVLTSGLVRIEFSADGQFEDRASTFAINRNLPVPKFTANKTETGGLELVTTTLRLSYDGKAFSPSGLQAYGVFPHFVGDLCGGTPEWRFGQEDPGNMGGTARTLDFTQGRVDTGTGIISKTGISMLDDSDSMLFTSDGWFAKREPERKDVYLFCFGSDHRGALNAFYKVSGSPPVLPRWALGNWWSKYYPYKQDEYLALMDKFEKEKIPLAVAVIDMDWHLIDIPPEHGASWTGYTWNKELFPDHVKFMSDLHDRNLKTTLNTHPSDGIRAFEDCYERICKKLGRDPSKGNPVHFDPTDKKFLEAYLTEVHHPLEDEGCDFWWLDWQQGKFSRTAGIDPLWMLNHYHFLDSKRTLGRRMTFSRFAGPGNQRYPIGFSGDTEILWSVLEFQPEFTATAANIGNGWWSHDIGGHHHGINDDELYARWVQFGLFSPILRLHSNWNTTIVREPWLRGSECQKVVTECLQFRHRMIPYLYTMSVRATLDGRSLLEPMYYDHPSDDYAYRNKNEYLFGSEMIVCPITTPKVYATNMGSVECWLPPGRYIDLFTGTVYDGDRVMTMHRPVHQIPVLCGAGSIIPLDNTEAVQNGAPLPDALEVIVTVGVDAEFTMMEDDGKAEDIEHITLTKTPIKYAQLNGQITIGPTQNPLVEKRSWTITLPAFPTDQLHRIFAKVDGLPVEFKVEQNDKEIKVHLNDPVDAKQQITIELGTGLRLRSNNLLQKVQEVVARAQIEHDTKHEILTHVKSHLKSDISAAVLVSRIAATEMNSDMRSALMEFILADDLSISTN